MSFLYFPVMLTRDVMGSEYATLWMASDPATRIHDMFYWNSGWNRVWYTEDWRITKLETSYYSNKPEKCTFKYSAEQDILLISYFDTDTVNCVFTTDSDICMMLEHSTVAGLVLKNASTRLCPGLLQTLELYPSLSQTKGMGEIVPSAD